jgi:hypothetical protein
MSHARFTETTIAVLWLLAMAFVATSLVVGLLLPAWAHAQEIGSVAETESGYTVADPVRPDALGLVTPEGRFAISRGDGCTIGPEQNVRVQFLVGFGRQIASLVPLDSDAAPACPIRFEQQMSDQPCWTNEAGECDIAAEYAEP